MGVGTLRRYRESGAPSDEAEAEVEVVDLAKLTVAQLKAHAVEHGIDLGEAKLKAELVDVISRAPVEPITDPSDEQVVGEPADGEVVTDENAAVVTDADGDQHVGEVVTDENAAVVTDADGDQHVGETPAPPES